MIPVCQFTVQNNASLIIVSKFGADSKTVEIKNPSDFPIIIYLEFNHSISGLHPLKAIYIPADQERIYELTHRLTANLQEV